MKLFEPSPKILKRKILRNEHASSRRGNQIMKRREILVNISMIYGINGQKILLSHCQ